ncbi:hypothetical protein TNCV_3024511 [Trichonephila clavipes]|nr:hypothetical protein TNCV_3024511 [Trichonephila clavipes]
MIANSRPMSFLSSSGCTEDPQCGMDDIQEIYEGSTSSHWCSMKIWRVRCQLRYRLHHSSVVQNYEGIYQRMGIAYGEHQ